MMITFQLPDALWLRGSDGYLLTFDDEQRRKQCCYGLACTQVGLNDDTLEEQFDLSDVRASLQIFGDPARGAAGLYALDFQQPHSSFADVRLKIVAAINTARAARGLPSSCVVSSDITPAELSYLVNDEPGLSDDQRVQWLNAIAKPYDFQFEYVP